MNFRQVAIVGTWLSIGFVIVAVSLWQGHQQAVWGREQLGDEASSAALIKWERPAELANLPDGWWLPGEIEYPIELLHDWLWWRMADSEVEEQRRLVYISLERLNAGWKLCEEGKWDDGLVTLMKAEAYLQEAAGSPPLVVEPVVQDAAKLHYIVLGELELQMPETLRPRVTELLNVSRGLVADSL